VIIGNLKLEADVITLFTRQEVPVTLINRRADSVAVFMPFHENLSHYYEKQKSFLSTDAQINRFKDWLYARRRNVQIYVLRRLSKKTARSFVKNGFREQDYQKFIAAFNPSGKDEWKVVSNIIISLFREMIIGCIIRADLSPHIGILNRRYNFGLALDILHILMPLADLQCIQFLRNEKDKGYMKRDLSGLYVTREGMRDVAQRFENIRKTTQKHTDMLLDHIFELMRELRK
jgi:CRISPR/Cas system-associated endonuclease Cas1